MSAHSILAAVVGLSLCAVAPAAAQGNGHAYGKNKSKPTVTSTASSPSGPSAAVQFEGATPGTGVRNFGAWLDDASVLTPGQGYVSIGFGLWKMPGYREVDIPTIDAGIGVHRRVQFGASLPYYHANEPGAPMARGFGTMNMNAKIQVHAPSKKGPGVSVTPAIEVLSAAPVGTNRVSWALPVNLEMQGAGWRAYGSTGYFSRGSVFASGAIEKALSEQMWVTGSITHAYSMGSDPLSGALGLSRTHTDVTGGAAYSVRDNLAVYGAIGRTISKKDANSAELVLTGGVSMNFAVK